MTWVILEHAEMENSSHPSILFISVGPWINRNSRYPTKINLWNSLPPERVTGWGCELPQANPAVFGYQRPELRLPRFSPSHPRAAARERAAVAGWDSGKLYQHFLLPLRFAAHFPHLPSLETGVYAGERPQSAEHMLRMLETWV